MNRNKLMVVSASLSHFQHDVAQRERTQSVFSAHMQVTAGPAFSHRLRSKRDEDHQLVTHGIYRLLRHPGYFGWFLWSVGSQVLLCNIFCTVGFFVVVRNQFQQKLSNSS